MQITFGPADYALAALMLAMLPLDAWISKRKWARLDDPGERAGFYVWTMGTSWLFCAGVLLLWALAGRPWSGLLLGPVEPWRMLLGFIVAAPCLIPALAMRRRGFKAVAKHGADKVRLGSLEPMIPHTPQERGLWTLVSITAGLCEEVMIRGFFLAFVAHFTGIVWAVPIGAAVFGLGHAYQGRQHIITTGIWGFAAAVIAVLSGSLWPVIVLHALQDLLMGDLGYRIVRLRTEYAAA